MSVILSLAVTVDYYVPSIEPDTPRFVIFLAYFCSQRSALFLERPEEKSIIRMAWTVDVDVACPITRKREYYVGKWFFDFIICGVEVLVVSWCSL